VDTGHHADLTGQSPDIGDATAVDTNLVAQDPLPDELLGQRSVRAGDLLLPALELRCQTLDNRVLESVGGLLARVLVGD
jgi:hypothetical protein